LFISSQSTSTSSANDLSRLLCSVLPASTIGAASRLAFLFFLIISNGISSIAIPFSKKLPKFLLYSSTNLLSLSTAFVPVDVPCECDEVASQGTGIMMT